MTSIRVLASDRNIVGEGPVWDERSGTLYWVDIVAKQIWSLDPRSRHKRVWSVPDVIGCMALRERGGAVLALRDGIYLFDFASGRADLFCQPDLAHPDNRANDGRCDSRGRLWFGTMQNNIDWDGRPKEIDRWGGNLYRVDPDGGFAHFGGGFGISNTVAWSPDDRTFYFGDTLASDLYAFDFDAETGVITNRRTFCHTEEHGMPDGSAVDVEGFVWNARHDGSCLIRYAPDGSIDRILDLPLRHPTSCCFGGDEMKTLFVTSLSHGMTEDDFAANPNEGALLAVDVGIEGLPSHRFAG
ncbi:MAG: SMP-30/gluconolactonase/LRE family protein [Geminicoccaceae bacterium]